MNSKKSLRNQQIFKIVFCALLVALIAIMTFVDPLGYITINVAAITLIHIPVIVGGILLGRKYGIILGLAFGLGSMIRSIIEYSLHAPFTNPILSVLPRMFIGFIAYDIYQFFTKTLRNNKLSVPLAMVTTTLLHSLIVIPLFYWIGISGFHFFADEYVFNPETHLFGFIWAVFLSNSLFEIALAMVIGTPIVLAIRKLMESKME